jgi:uncharacterized repeat protein (TIGR02543 family)
MTCPGSLSLRTAFPLLLLVLACLFPSSQTFAQQEPELRGVWVDTWGSGFRTASEIDALIARVQRGNFNAIFPQVRRRGDAFYNSTIEPRNSAVAANFDPLAYLIERAHAANPRIEVHAWIVVYPIWANRTTPPTSPDHVFNKRPDWLTQTAMGTQWDGTDVNGNYYVDPAHPEVQQHTFDVSMDIISRYNVDGFHLDYIRYSSRNFGYNPVAVERFNTLHNRSGLPATTDAAWLQFRRDQVTGLVRKLYLEAIALKPDIKMSAATIGFAPGITTTSQWPNSAAYSDKLQDWRAWMEEGILDINMPMFYFDQQQYATAWSRWNTFAKNHKYNRHLAVGLGWWLNTVEDTLWQTRDTRLPTSLGHRAEGTIGFQYRAYSTGNNSGVGHNAFFDAFSKASVFDSNPTPVFAQKVSPPAMPWKVNPTRGHIKGYVSNADTGGVFDGATVTLTGPQSRTLRTDGTGFFGLLELPPGTYTVTASLPGSPYENRSTQVTVAAGQVASADIPLFIEPSAEIIIDNPAATFSGSWTTTTHSSQYGENHRRAFTTTNSSPTATATYRPFITVSGLYDIHVWYVEGGNRSPDAPYLVQHSGGQETLRLDQRGGGGGWQLLAGRRHFEFGDDGYVQLGNHAGPDVVVADAIRFSLVEPDPDPALFFSEPLVYPGGVTATVVFSTERPANVQVEYGLTQTTTQTGPATTTPRDAHSIRLTGLIPGETYHARLHATEGAKTYTSNWFSFATVPDIILDNTSAGTTFSGPWTVSSDTTTGWNTYRFASRVSGSPTATATFRPDLPVSGTYNVSTFYREGTNRVTDAPFLISWNGGSQTVAVNQQINGRTWFSLASNRPFAAGTGGFVRISNGPSQVGSVIIADAVRFTLVEPAIIHALNVQTEGAGNVSRTPNATAYAHGSSVQLTANPGSGWQFTGWTGDIVSSEPQITVTMHAPLNLTAHFRQLFEISVIVNGEGSVSLAPDQTRFAEGDVVELSALPAEGWEFDSWSGDAPGFDNPLSLPVNGPMTIVAQFTRPSAYLAWVSEHFSTEEQADETISGPGADPFGHGVPNLLKFAFGMHPRQPDLNRLPSLELVDGFLTLTYYRIPSQSYVEYIIEQSSTFGTWAPANGDYTEVKVEEVDQGRVERVSVRATSPAEGQRQFVRVRVNRL